MKADARVKMAGVIGRYFRVDPIEVLKSTTFEWNVRIAAYEVAAEAEAKAHEEASKK